MQRQDIRNVAIIAHVDHGKTTLLDKMLEQTGMLSQFKEVEERVMDSNPLEKERGITILAKNTSIRYQEKKINIVDTPGHADFGGEVERILNMVDGVLLLVDAFDGPMPQTKFVLRKALALGLLPIVVINKIDRPGARPDEVLNMVFDLFVELNASDRQLDFTHIFASAKEGYAKLKMEEENVNLNALFDTILNKIPAPVVETDKPFQMLVTNLQYDNYLGRLLLGRIHRGIAVSGKRVTRIEVDGKLTQGKITKLFGFNGLMREEIESAPAGDIVMVAGMPDAVIGETLADPEMPEALPAILVDAPTISMNFRVNDSPFAGTEGKFVTSRHLRDRLQRELLSNISLRVEETDTMEEFKVSGRGELHLSILIENMRREGYEFAVSRPKVILKDINGQICEPIEELMLEVPEQGMGSVMEEIGRRKAVVMNMESISQTVVRIHAHIPTRGLIAFRSLFLTLTRGEGMMNHSFLEYQPYKGETTTRQNGVMIAMEQGEATPYAIWKLQDRGYFIIPSNIQVYEGMIMGAHSRDNDLVINVCTKKQLTNVRSKNADDAIRLTPHRNLNLEQSLEFIEDDELVEITPQNIRLRKRYLTENERKIQEKKRKVLATH